MNKECRKHKTNIPSLDQVFEDCDFYIRLLRESPKGYLLTRGVNKDSIDIEIEYIDRDRRPLNMPVVIHDKLNTHFKEQIGWKVRSAVFSNGYPIKEKPADLLGYGKTYLLFPIGKFHFAYDPKIHDLTLHYYLSDAKTFDEYISTINYRYYDLGKAMTSVLDNNDRSVEIMIDVDRYYLVNCNYAQKIKSSIW